MNSYVFEEYCEIIPKIMGTKVPDDCTALPPIVMTRKCQQMESIKNMVQVLRQLLPIVGGGVGTQSPLPVASVALGGPNFKLPVKKKMLIVQAFRAFRA